MRALGLCLLKVDCCQVVGKRTDACLRVRRVSYLHRIKEQIVGNLHVASKSAAAEGCMHACAQGKSEGEIAKFSKLFGEIQQQIDTKQLRPMIRTQYLRTAFQIPFDSTVRISLDTNLTMIKENPDDGPTCTVAGRSVLFLSLAFKMLNRFCCLSSADHLWLQASCALTPQDPLACACSIDRHCKELSGRVCSPCWERCNRSVGPCFCNADSHHLLKMLALSCHALVLLAGRSLLLSVLIVDLQAYNKVFLASQHLPITVCSLLEHHCLMWLQHLIGLNN